jgi:hypothetical protein
MVEGEKQTVYITTVHHKHGEDTWVNATEAGAKEALYEYVKEWWDELWEDICYEDAPPIPEDRDAAIAAYFKKWKDESDLEPEWYESGAQEVGP